MNNLLLNILKAIVPGYADLLKDKEHSHKRIETLEKELEKIRNLQNRQNLQNRLKDTAEVPKAKTVEAIPEFFKSPDETTTKKIPQPYSNTPPSPARVQAQSSPVEQLMPGTLATVLVTDAASNADHQRSGHSSSSEQATKTRDDSDSYCSSRYSSSSGSSSSHSSSSHSSYDSSSSHDSSSSCSSSSSSWD